MLIGMPGYFCGTPVRYKAVELVITLFGLSRGLEVGAGVPGFPYWIYIGRVGVGLLDVLLCKPCYYGLTEPGTWWCYGVKSIRLPAPSVITVFFALGLRGI